MNYCLAITKKGYQCKNNKIKKNLMRDNNPILFCDLHYKKFPEFIIIQDTHQIINFINIEHYLEESKYILNPNLPPPQQPNLDLTSSYHKQKDYQENYNHDNNQCYVCNNKEESNLLSCSASKYKYNHKVCLECLKGHIMSLLSDGIASLECMFHKHEHCQGQYTEQHIKSALEYNQPLETDPAPETNINIPSTPYQTFHFSKWQEILNASEIIKLASICENYLICPLCTSWGCIFEIPNGGEKYPFYINCAVCKQDWCTLCKRKSHAARHCYNLTFTDTEQNNKDLMIQSIDKMIQDIATRALTHCCGICGCSYIKEEGCNLMTCPKCNGMSCYICGIKLYYKGTNKYWHFSGHENADINAICPLWNNIAGDKQEKQGNTAFNLTRIEKELFNFISYNKSNQDIFILICQRIITNFKRDKNFIKIIQKIYKIIS